MLTLALKPEIQVVQDASIDSYTNKIAYINCLTFSSSVLHFKQVYYIRHPDDGGSRLLCTLLSIYQTTRCSISKDRTR